MAVEGAITQERQEKLFGPTLIRRHGLLAILKEDFATHRRKLSLPGFQALAVYRYGTWTQTFRPALVRKPLRVVYYLLASFVRNVYGIEIDDTVKVGRRLTIGHQSGIVIHAYATIGDDCIIRQNVTFGAGTEKWTPGVGPVIGDRVRFGVGVVVVGTVTIGDDVHIGPNCTISSSVPSNRTVFVAPPRVLPRSADENASPP